ncbi:hypothetical protein LUZ60_011595 [Juncus effusus]|nr:hypothetical protein LUZ60_011595 [Juncus effusus]
MFSTNYKIQPSLGRSNQIPNPTCLSLFMLSFISLPSQSKLSLNQCRLHTVSPPNRMPNPTPSFFFLLFLFPFLLPPPSLAQSNSVSCPLNFSILVPYLSSSSIPSDTPSRCSFALQSLHLVLSQYLLTDSRFLPPLNTSSSCWSSLTTSLSPLFPPFTLPSSCGFQSSWISQGCMNITTRQDFESIVPPSSISDMAKNCNGSLQPVPTCTGCTTSLNRVKASYLTGPDNGNVTTCADYPSIYASAFNSLGPSNPGTAFCLFLLTTSNSPSSSTKNSGSHEWIFILVAGCIVLFLVLIALTFWWFKRKQSRGIRRRRRTEVSSIQTTPRALESISTTVIKFTLDEIREATRNFSRDNIIGRGGYGNVYKGVFPDGSEVAVKRFKNCSAAGEETFVHEVEVIASVRHVNLVALRGYCICTTQLEGHQRIIVCDLIPNGSLQDHIFSSGENSLSWPVRQKIAIGTARGLAYLHYGAQPMIIHRDIKASNILLNSDFEAKVADFGLAKFAPEGMTHFSTRVAGTLGYVAPEYALYGQLTEKSDVYSFGVVLLELLSGKKAFISLGEGQSFVITDWAWALVRGGRTLEVIQEGMEGRGSNEQMEKFVIVAVLCTHPQLYARPTMDQVVKILESDSVMPMPVVPDRPIPIVANREDIERSVSIDSGGSGQLFSPTGFQSFSYGNESRVDSYDSSEKGKSAAQSQVDSYDSSEKGKIVIQS